MKLIVEIDKKGHIIIYLVVNIKVVLLSRISLLYFSIDLDFCLNFCLQLVRTIYTKNFKQYN